MGCLALALLRCDLRGGAERRKKKTERSLLRQLRLGTEAGVGNLKAMGFFCWTGLGSGRTNHKCRSVAGQASCPLAGGVSQSGLGDESVPLPSLQPEVRDVFRYGSSSILVK